MNRTNSILLNSPTQSPRLTPQQLPSYPSSADSSCSSSEMHVQMHRSASTPRRIRFAPLPDQNQTIDTVTQIDSPPIPSLPTVDSKPKPKSSSFFFQLFKRSSLVIDPPQRRFSTEDITSRILGRPRTPQAQEFGSPLSRTSSSSTTQPKRPSTAPSDSKPRSSINSLGSGGGRHTMPPNRFTPPSSPTSSTRASFPTKSGMRMLNGRVYGSKRQPPTDPFANVRDEPEFVEWGYGGMGSVKGSSDSKYSVLAKGAPALLSHGQSQASKISVGGGRGGAAVAMERKDGVGGGDDDDDGSGMGWVRRRKLERERLAREKEATELTTALDIDSRRTSTDGSSAVDSTSTDLSTLAASSAPTTPPSTTETLPPDHILQAVRLSPTHHHHKRLSPEDLVVDTTLSPIQPANISPSTASESSSDEDETPKEDDSDESEVEETEDHRKTSLGAGVEKISRHKEGVH